MRISHLRLKNWRNFRSIECSLQERAFIVGPNAAGKSNLLDVFRFLRDIAKSEGGGLQKAIRDRGGISKIRCLAARNEPEVEVAIEIVDDDKDTPKWKYEIGIKQEPRGERLPYLFYEKVWRGETLILDRPDRMDRADPARLTQTHLEQISSNRKFREIARFLQAVTYLHLVPQLIRFAEEFQSRRLEDDPFGQAFLENVANTQEKTRSSRLMKIEQVLKIAVPQMKQLQFRRDESTGRPHLEALYSHWRPNAGWQREDQFSDGTLRLMGLLWCLLEKDSVLLLEEPELSLNAAIVRRLASVIERTQRSRSRQIIISTHSGDLLSDKGIDSKEVLFLQPHAEGTSVVVAAKMREIKLLLDQGLTIGEAVLPLAAPTTISQFSLFD